MDRSQGTEKTQRGRSGVVVPETGSSDASDLSELDVRHRLEALESAMDGVAIFDETMEVRYANPAFREIYQFATADALRAQISGDAGWERLFAPDALNRLREEILPVVKRSGDWRGRVPARRSDGEGFTAELSWARVNGSGFVITLRDVTAQAGAEAELARRQELYSLLTHNSTDVISLHDVEGEIIYVSPSSLRLMGCEKTTLIGSAPWPSIHPDDIDRAREAFGRALAGASASVSYRLKVKSGVWVWFETLVRPVSLDADERVTRVQCSTRDITERKKLEEQLEHQALHDPLTGLPNRSLFMDRLAQAPLRARRGRSAYGIVYLDLNRFKEINDTLGHAAGDALLVEVAERLSSQMRETDTLARLSGDEFAIVLEGLEDRTVLEQMGPRLVAIFDEPFEIDGTGVTIRPSVGAVIDESGTADPESLLRAADLAMYAAKRDPEREWILQVGVGDGASEALQDALREALEADDLALHYQPVVAATDGRPVAVEALLRWEHPEHGWITPPEVLAIAQQAGIGDQLTRWVVRRAIADSRVWSQSGFAHLRVCVNLSDDELTSPEIGRILREAVEEVDGERPALQLELKSRVLRRHADKLAALRAVGAIIAIDGFGVDPVSLPVLARAPIDALKIARPLVDSLGEEAGEAAAGAILGLGGRLGLQITAEGIETEEQARRLGEMGADSIQGFYVGRPLPADRLTEFLRALPTNG